MVIPGVGLGLSGHQYGPQPGLGPGRRHPLGQTPLWAPPTGDIVSTTTVTANVGALNDGCDAM